MENLPSRALVCKRGFMKNSASKKVQAKNPVKKYNKYKHDIKINRTWTSDINGSLSMKYLKFTANMSNVLNSNFMLSCYHPSTMTVSSIISWSFLLCKCISVPATAGSEPARPGWMPYKVLFNYRQPARTSRLGHRPHMSLCSQRLTPEKKKNTPALWWLRLIKPYSTTIRHSIEWDIWPFTKI